MLLLFLVKRACVTRYGHRASRAFGSSLADENKVENERSGVTNLKSRSADFPAAT